MQSRLFGVLIGVGVFLIVIAILAVIQVTPYETYKNKAARIQIKYPAYWKLVDHPDNAPGAIAAFVSPPQTALDTYSENANISVQDLSAKPMNLSQFSQLAIRQMTGTFHDEIQVLESDTTQLAGRPAYRFVYLTKMPDSNLKFMNIWVIAGTRAYIFTYSAAEKDFDVFRSEVDTMLKSFKIF